MLDVSGGAQINCYIPAYRKNALSRLLFVISKVYRTRTYARTYVHIYYAIYLHICTGARLGGELIYLHTYICCIFTEIEKYEKSCETRQMYRRIRDE